IWRTWSDAIAEARFEPNERQTVLDDEALLGIVCQIAKRLERFPSTNDLDYELRRHPDAPNVKTIMSRWKMSALAAALRVYAERNGAPEVAQYAQDYAPPRRAREGDVMGPMSAVGYVYMQRHGQDYKIGFTTSLNKRGRQIQIELPQ